MNNEIVPGFDNEEVQNLRIDLHDISAGKEIISLHITGYIDATNTAGFQKLVSKVTDAGYMKLVFVCNSLNYLSSSGIGSFTGFYNTVKPKGGNIVLVGIQPKVFEVFQLLGFTSFFIIMNSMDEAVAFFNKNTNPGEKSVYPGIIPCPVCMAKLKVLKTGRYRCSKCKGLINVDENGVVTPAGK
jgi:anti-anti-sigma factor